MPGLFPDSLDADDHGFVVADDGQVGLGRQGGGLAAEPEDVPVLDRPGVASFIPLRPLAVQQRRVVR